MAMRCPTDFRLRPGQAGEGWLIGLRAAASEWGLFGFLALRTGFLLQRNLELLARPGSQYPDAQRWIRWLVAQVLLRWPATRKVREWMDCMSLELDHNHRISAELESRIDETLKRLALSTEPDGVVMAISSLGAGGAERQMTQLAAGLVASGLTVRVAVKHTGHVRFDAFEPTLKAAGIDIVAVPLEYSDEIAIDLPALDCNLYALVRGLAIVFAQWKPAVCHGWMDELGAASALAGVIQGVPRVVIDLRGFNPTWFETRGVESIRAVMRVLGRRRDVTFVANSLAGADDYQAWLGERPADLRVVRNSIVPDTLQATAEEVRALRAQFCSPRHKLVGGLMRLGWEKDPVKWVDVAARLCVDRDDVRFVLFGDGPLRHQVEAHIRRVGMTRRIVLAGHVRNRGAALKAMDALLLTSKIEGTPNVLLEAQSLGTPFVASDVGGVSECVAPGLRSFVIAADTPDGLARGISEALLMNRSSVELASKAFLVEEFAATNQLREYLRIYSAEGSAA